MHSISVLPFFVICSIVFKICRGANTFLGYFRTLHIIPQDNMCKCIWAFAGNMCSFAHVFATEQAYVCVFRIKSFTPDLKIRQGISETHPPPGTLSPAISTTTFNQQQPPMYHIQSELNNTFIFVLILLSHSLQPDWPHCNIKATVRAVDC